VSVDLAGNTAYAPAAQWSPGGQHRPISGKTEALQAEIARLEARAADHRADFERERERTDRLTVELLQATAETMAAKEATARLEGEVAALRTGGRAGGPIDSHGQAARRLGHLAPP